VIDSTALKALESEVHVWIAYPDAVSPEHLARHYLPILDQEERDRYQRFYFDPDRHIYLAAHALLRMTLSRYAPCTPDQWRFVRGEQGKPEIAPAAGTPPLRFNLSHTKGMVACVVTLEHDCGVDVECVRPMKDMKGIAEAVFSEAENAYLNAQHEADWPHGFFTFWTLKEAYIKAIGQGLSAPLKKIGFDIDAVPIRARFENEELTETGWHFLHREIKAMHHLAIAIRLTNSTNLIEFYEQSFLADLDNNLLRSCTDFKLSATL
jgi:4'-phosphopantetheinyl transferase